MNMNSYLQRYKLNSVTTASPKSIIVQLHDKALMELQLAHESWQNENIAEMRPHITAIQDIISHLHSSLDPNIELSGTLAELYKYHLIRLSNIYTNPTEQLFNEVKQFLDEWRQTWWKAEPSGALSQ